MAAPAASAGVDAVVDAKNTPEVLGVNLASLSYADMRRLKMYPPASCNWAEARNLMMWNGDVNAFTSREQLYNFFVPPGASSYGTNMGTALARGQTTYDKNGAEISSYWEDTLAAKSEDAASAVGQFYNYTFFPVEMSANLGITEQQERFRVGPGGIPMSQGMTEKKVKSHAMAQFCVVYSSFPLARKGTDQKQTPGAQQAARVLPFDPSYKQVRVSDSIYVYIDITLVKRDPSAQLATVAALVNSTPKNASYITFFPSAGNIGWDQTFNTPAKYQLLTSASLGIAVQACVIGCAPINYTGYTKWLRPDTMLYPQYAYKYQLAAQNAADGMGADGLNLYPEGRVSNQLPDFNVSSAMQIKYNENTPPVDVKGLVRTAGQINYVEEVGAIYQKILYCSANNAPLIIPAFSETGESIASIFNKFPMGSPQRLLIPVIQSMYTTEKALQGIPILRGPRTGATISEISMAHSISDLLILQALYMTAMILVKKSLQETKFLTIAGARGMSSEDILRQETNSLQALRVILGDKADSLEKLRAENKAYKAQLQRAPDLTAARTLKAQHEAARERRQKIKKAAKQAVAGERSKVRTAIKEKSDATKKKAKILPAELFPLKYQRLRGTLSGTNYRTQAKEIKERVAKEKNIVEKQVPLARQVAFDLSQIERPPKRVAGNPLTRRFPEYKGTVEDLYGLPPAPVVPLSQRSEIATRAASVVPAVTPQAGRSRAREEEEKQ